MSQAVVNLDRAAVSTSRRRIRFDMERSQLVALTIAVAILALLLLLGGLAVGLLIDPRRTSPEQSSPSAVLPRSAEPTPPRPGVLVTGHKDPLGRRPAESTPEASYRALNASLADIVWKPRERSSQRRAAQRNVDTPTAEVSAAGVSAARVSAAASDVASVDGSEPAQWASVQDSASAVRFEPRPGGLAQPPSRWRRAQPLAAAYLTSPDDTFSPPPDAADRPLQAPEQADILDPSEPPTPSGSTTFDETFPRSAGASSDASKQEAPQPDPRAASRRSAESRTAAEPAAGEWQPVSDHWQAFYGALNGTEVDGPSGESAPPETDTPTDHSAGLDGRRAAPPPLPVDAATTGAATPDAATTEAATADVTAEIIGGGEAADDGWQPSSGLWQSFLEDPYDWTAERLPAAAVRPAGPRGSMGVPFGDLMDRAAARHGVDVALVAAMVRVESSYDAQAVSHRGARGLMQVMPATARRFGVAADDLFDPAVNLDVGLRYLSWLDSRFDGDTLRMLAAYNAGEAAVESYGGVPPYRETQQYVKRIYGLMGWAEPAVEP